jgi:hypothetical protein
LRRHRVRGETLLKRDPTNTTPVEMRSLLSGLRNFQFHKTEVLTGPLSEAHDAAAQIDRLLDEPRKCAKAWRSIRYDGA